MEGKAKAKRKHVASKPLTMSQSLSSQLLIKERKFMKELEDSIKDITAIKKTMFRLGLVAKNDRSQYLEDHVTREGETVLMLATMYPIRSKITLNKGQEQKERDEDKRVDGEEEEMDYKDLIERIIQLWPQMVYRWREGEYQGQTVLHNYISKQDTDSTQWLLNRVDNPERLLNAKATGSGFHGTVMMGELPLFVAALTGNEGMVKILLQHGASFTAVNSKGDTIFHCLVRYASIYPEKEEDICHTMMQTYNTMLNPEVQEGAPKRKKKGERNSDQGATKIKSKQKLAHGETTPRIEGGAQLTDIRALWLQENQEGLTVLRLAATHGLAVLFKAVLRLQGVYCRMDRKDGFFDSLLYDITEIDPVARKHFVQETSATPKRSSVSPKLTLDDSSVIVNQSKSAADTDQRRFCSVLEIICETKNVTKAFEVMDTSVVRMIIESKWSCYKKWFYTWFILHLLLLAFLASYAVVKAQVIRERKESPAASTWLSSSNQRLVMAGSIIFSLVSLIMMTFEGSRLLSALLQLLGCKVRWLLKPEPLNLLSIHHNGIYRLTLFILALFIIVDSLWLWILGPDNNIFLILALLMAFWFLSFFFRPFRKFSFFTVMLRKVIFGDLMRFAVLIALDLVAFTVAMYVAFLSKPRTEGAEEEHGFNDLAASFLTMFQLMLGLDSLEHLGEAPQPWLVTALFVLFALLTYLLMLNALIAMMSNTCSYIATDRNAQWQLQRLSVILMIESILPTRFQHNSGKGERTDIQEQGQTRYFIKVTTVQTKKVEQNLDLLAALAKQTQERSKTGGTTDFLAFRTMLQTPAKTDKSAATSKKRKEDREPLTTNLSTESGSLNHSTELKPRPTNRLSESRMPSPTEQTIAPNGSGLYQTSSIQQD